jgi:hypothetical protein
MPAGELEYSASQNLAAYIALKRDLDTIRRPNRVVAATAEDRLIRAITIHHHQLLIAVRDPGPVRRPRGRLIAGGEGGGETIEVRLDPRSRLAPFLDARRPSKIALPES